MRTKGLAWDALSEVLAAAVSLTCASELERILETLLESLEALVPYDAANVMLVEGDQLVVRAIRGYERRGDASLTARSSFSVAHHPVLGRVLQGRESLLVADTTRHAGWQQHAGAEFVRSWIGVPLIAGKTVIGLYSVDKAAPGFFTPAHVHRTETLAPYAAVAIERARLIERLSQSQQQLRTRVAELQTLLDVVPVGIGIARDPECHEIRGNRYLSRLFGRPQEENLSLSPPPSERPPDVQLFHAGRALAPEEMPMQQAARHGVESVGVELEVVRKGRRIATLLSSAVPLRDEDGQPCGAIGTSLDITERKRAERQIRRLAYHDALTKLPNRRLFADRLGVTIAQARRAKRGLAILFVDLDRFKLINDSLGHAIGDRLIQAVAQRLKQSVRESDTVARMAGDEFTVLLPELRGAADAVRIGQKLLAVLRRPFRIQGHELFITASIGISLFPDDGKNASSLLSNADAAMYRAKELGRDACEAYQGGTNAGLMERLDIENSLRKAVARKRLFLHYQPVVELATGRLHGFEALLRWPHPELGVLSPARLMMAPDVAGPLLPASSWVLGEACSQLRSWQLESGRDLVVAVNLSAHQFHQPGLVDTVGRALADSGLPPSSLELEITESSAMQDASASVRLLGDLKGLGVRLAIDDFGTGYSSLSYLKRFPIDALKIDQSFVRDIPGDPDDAAIATTVIAMAHALRLEVVAEGVETEEQLAFLRSRGCDRVQGYHLGRPQPAREAGALVERSLAS